MLFRELAALLQNFNFMNFFELLEMEGSSGRKQGSNRQPFNYQLTSFATVSSLGANRLVREGHGNI